MSAPQQPYTVVNLCGLVKGKPTKKTVGEYEIVEFPLMVTKEFADKRDGTSAEYEYYDVTVWNTDLQERVMAELYEGSSAAVSGKMTLREWNDRIYYKVNASFVGIVEWFRSNRQAKPAPRPAPKPPVEEEFPF